ncbi:MAG TPA: efflux RND transporter periplasmic adaptor subunit [Thermoanaerobaculaceae bacterium]|nr:efflux RND transporter periplasmic adaptor subunit [Thermoanaerobaculaceae bacterium]
MSHGPFRRTPYRELAACALGTLGVLGLLGCSKAGPQGPAAPEVYVADVVQRDVPVYLELVGQTKGSQDVEIRARVEGYLESMNFTEGTYVSKGTLLYQIDPKPFEATLAAAKANLATARARLDKTNNDVARYRPLVAQQAVSRQELDNAVSAQEAATAMVDAAKAAVDQATLDLGYTRITSPLDGLVGTTQVKAGNLVGRGESTLLTTVSAMDPILFRAGISEAEYLRLAKEIVETGRRTGPEAEIELLLADGTVFPYKGRIDSIERAVDPTTGTLAVQFKFPNPDHLLRPGQYGRARFVVQTKKGALLVPQRAVQELQNLYSVAVVSADNKVAFRNVKVGPRVDGLWVIDEGLKPGERVIVEGLQKVREGAAVSPKPVPATSSQPVAAEPAGKAE